MTFKNNKNLHMKTKISTLSLGIALSLSILISCGTQNNSTNNKIPDMHNSQTSLDYDGIYRGILPCADCEGIKTTLYLMRDQTYKIVSDYQGKEGGVFETSGKFSWDKSGSIITLKDQDGVTKYKVGEDHLIMLDQEGKTITSALAKNYILTKGNYSILNKKWRLMELMGKKISSQETLGKEGFLEFNDKENRYVASVGCNTISGQFSVESFNRIQLKGGISTMKACENNDLENQLKEVIRTADSFQVNGDELTLIKGRMAPLAKFKIPMN